MVIWAFLVFYLIHWGATWALDLRVYRDAVLSLRHHGSPYTQYFTPSTLSFTYPPFALLIMTPLSFGPLGLVKTLWWVLDAVALFGVLYFAITNALGVSRRRAAILSVALGAAATIALEPLRSNLDYGQVNLLLMALVVIDVLRVRGRGRGVLVGLAAAIKLTPLIYLAYFIVVRDRRALARGAATFVLATGFSWAIIPSQATHYWLHDAFSPNRTGSAAFVSNQSLNGILHRPPFHAGALGVVLWVGLSVVTVAVAVLSARRLVELGRTVDALLVLALAELLVSPISWSHHWSWLVLAPIVAWERWGKDRAVVIALGCAVGVAFTEPYWWPVGGWPGALFGDSLTLAGIALFAVMCWRARREYAAVHGTGAGISPVH